MIRWSNTPGTFSQQIVDERPRRRARSVPTTLLAPGAFLYLATALVGVWAARDHFLAWLRFLEMAGVVGVLLVASTIYGDVRRLFWRFLGPVAALLGTFLTLIYTVFLHLWRVQPESLPLSPTAIITGDTIDGLLPLLFPLALAGVWYAWRENASWYERIGVTAATVFMTLGILLSTSRSVLTSLFVGGLALVYLQLRARFPGWRRFDGAVFLLVPAVVGVAYIVLISNPNLLPGYEFMGSRLSTWRDMSLLIVDYPFTGSGLVGTEIVYSTYVHLVHVPFLYHAYNLYLQIAIEQGILGTVGFLWLAGCAVWYSGPWRAKEWTFQRAAVHAATITLLVYGMFDSETYKSVWMPLMFLPLAAAFALTIEDEAVPTPQVFRQLSVRVAIGSGLAVLVFCGLLFGIPSVRARWHANLGAAIQTQVELQDYEWPKWPIQDIMRLRLQTELARAMEEYEKALALNPRDPVANRRLGQIELDLKDFASARQHLEVAYEEMPRHRATRQLLGESYALTGDLEAAAAMWRGMELNQDQLELRRWWYDFIGEKQLANQIRAAQALSKR